MNTSALKTFAPAVRRQLMEAVTRKLDFALTAKTPDLLKTFAPQVAALRKLADSDRAGLIERVAYTWFNRLAALRFMDARGWHPFRARVLTSASPAETQPELLKLTRTGALPEELKSHTSPARLNDLLDGRIPSPDAQGEVYRHLVLAACRFYHALLPNLFEKLDDETELLLPDDLLTEHSVVHGFRTEISDEDCGDGQRANVEILGWLYQFYISERKDQVMARKSAVPTEDIPAVTQLFTPHWIVRYLVENSLGRLWLLNRPGSRLREHMPYYIEGEPETDFLKITKPEDIMLLDPACGSAHMLTYSFDLLYLIYEEEGYAPTEIPALILRHNLHGLEICPRAAQLAELALVFKAREKSRRFFQPEHLVRPHIIELRDVRFAENELRDYIHALGLGDLFNQPVLRLLHQLEEAKNFGSLIQPCLDERAIADLRRAIEAKDLGGQLFLRETHLKVLRVLEQAEALTQRYHVVVVNPPYLANMNPQLKLFSNLHYPKTKADTFSMFIERCLALICDKGFTASVTMQSWMFLTTFTALRRDIVLKLQIENCIQIGFNSFPELNSKVAQAVALTISKQPPLRAGIYFDLNSARQSADKGEVFRSQLQTGAVFRASNKELLEIPGAPIAYRVSPALRRAFDARKVGELTWGEGKNVTADNERFLRLVWEVSAASVGRERKWIVYSKGGPYRKWAGNLEYVCDWSAEARAFYKSNHASRLIDPSMWYQPGITWTVISSSGVGFRYLPADTTFDTKGLALFFADTTQQLPVLGLLNSVVAREMFSTINTTLCINTIDVKAIPLPASLPDVTARVELLMDVARADWDNFETSWDFRDQPLLRPGLKGATLEASWRNWEAQSTAAIRRMQELETENNRLFIAAYGLDGELQPEVPEAQITLARAEIRRDMAAFLSYAVGCMMGRYGLDHPGLILANAGDVVEFVKDKDGKVLSGKATHEGADEPFFKIDPKSFLLDEDGIIPVLDGEWFEDDIVARTRDFLRATFGEATLRENLRFLEDSLGKDLRKYFLNDFYKDHLQTYKKRPIYWLVQSPRKGFSVLLYLHRYTRDTMNLVLNRYLRDYQVKLRNRLAHLTQVQATAPTAKAKTEARKEADKLTKTLHECDEWERQTVLPLAQARIELDLDDGVKTNYLKLGEALAPITGLAAREDE
jgi:hypothetical protein